MRTSLDDDDSDSDSDNGSDPTRGSDSEDDMLEASDQMLRFSSHDQPGSWDDFGDLVEKAKERERNANGQIEAEVIVDFGALSFVEKRKTSHKVEDDKEASIRKALSLGNEEELWCTFATLFLPLTC